MLPAPTTIASSTPRDWMSTSSSAIDSIVARSMPYSLGPISASPESFRRIRPNAGAASGVATAPSGSGSVIGSAREREPFELQHLGARFGQRLSDRLTGVVDPGLLRQDPRREEALVQHAVDDLLARLLGLGIDLVRIGIDLALCRDDVLRHVLAAHPLRGGRGDVHRNEPAELGVASAHLDERAQLVRGGVRIAGDPAAVDGLEARGADDRDVLAQLRNEVDALVLELRECVDAFGIHELQRLLCKRLEVVAVRDEVGFTAQRHDRPLRRVARERVADLALRRLTVGALGGLPEALLAQELLRRLDVTTRVDERSLGVHHPRPGQVAELLDERGGDGGHDWASSVLWAAAGSTVSSPCDSTSCSGASATSSAAGSGASTTSSAAGSGASTTSSAAGSGASTTASATGSGAGSGASSATAPFPLGLGRANSSAVTADWPAAIPSAIARMTSEHERIASSLPGITKSASSGSQFVSTRATTGRPSRRASRTASCSLRRSTMNTASGCLRMSATPPRFASSFSSSLSIVIRSFAGSSSIWPSSLSRRSSCSRSMRLEIVRQFVSSPPSQRWLTYGICTRAACSAIASWLCFFVPTNRIDPPRLAMLRANSWAASSRSSVCWRSMM